MAPKHINNYNINQQMLRKQFYTNLSKRMWLVKQHLKFSTGSNLMVSTKIQN